MVRNIVLVLLVAVVAAGCFPVNGDRDARRGYRLLLDRKFKNAASALEKALEKGLQKEKAEIVHTCLGNAYNELDRFEEAIAQHKKALDVNPKFHKAWVNLGICHRLTGKFDEAEKCYKKALELKPDYAELWASMGALYIHQGKYDEAVKVLRKSVSLDKNVAVAWSNLSLALASVGDFDEADKCLKKAVVLGYRNGPLVQKRINALRSMSGGGK